MHASTCKFCKISKNGADLHLHDKPFMQTSMAFAIPSIGAMVEGWSLVCPIEHRLSIRELYADHQFMSFVHEVDARIRGMYGETIWFEHGASCEGSLTGCGTDHAHLHIVPTSKISLEELGDSGLLWNRVLASDIAKISENREYLFISNSPSKENLIGYIHEVDIPSSQFFRKIIAKKLGIEEQFNYRTNQFKSTTEATASKLASLSC